MLSPSWWNSTKTVREVQALFLGISFTSDGRQINDLDIRIGKTRQCSNAPAPPIYDTATGGLHQDKAIHFQISLCSCSDLWP